MVGLSRSGSPKADAAPDGRASIPGAGTGLRFSPSTIRGRIILLTAAGLAVLLASNFYLSERLAKNSAATVEMAKLLGSIERAENAQLAFGEMRYWMTDLAVSLLTLSETKAKEAQARTEHYLDQLAAQEPDSIAAVRSEVE